MFEKFYFNRPIPGNVIKGNFGGDEDGGVPVQDATKDASFLLSDDVMGIIIERAASDGASVTKAFIDIITTYLNLNSNTGSNNEQEETGE